MRVLVACEYSGIVGDAFRDAGHDVWSVDLLPTESRYRDSKHYMGDIWKFFDQVLPPEYFDLMIAHPPCTHLSVSGARWFPPYKQKGERGYKPLHLRFEALAFVDKLMNLPIEKICIENPVSVISSHIRKADQTINPYQFGHPEQKRTCFWLKNLPKLKETLNCKEYMMTLPIAERQRIHWLGSNKGKERSKFYAGIAKAMVEQWGEING